MVSGRRDGLVAQVLDGRTMMAIGLVGSKRCMGMHVSHDYRVRLAEERKS
jgi:hypothetical protein